MKHILKCGSCGQYTLQNKCCGTTANSPKPVKFSPEDPYGKYHRTAKKESLTERGLL
ncbi:nucleolar RNA-binding Nop10p family protein [archaeon]|nr:nucleolar RNA-binding Nop10p family protein [archaeon]